MKTPTRQSGLTLTELLTTMVIIVLLTSFSLPAINALMNSFGSAGSAEAMINAALSNARAIAIKEHRYAGIRFQLAYNASDPNPFDADQYMIFIVYDYDKTHLACGFRAVEGIQPIKLQGNFNVMDLFARDNFSDADNASQPKITSNDLVNHLPDVASFSIIFSPSGKMVMQKVRTRNRGGDPTPTIPGPSDYDEIFNSPENIGAGYGRFVQDDYPDIGFGAEYSKSYFVIIDKNKFQRLDGPDRLTYVNSLRPLYISPYTGRIISTD